MSPRHLNPGRSLFPRVAQRCRGAGSAELEAEATVARMMGRAYTKTPDPSLITASAPGEGEDKTYLLFTTGSLTYSPHQIGTALKQTGSHDAYTTSTLSRAWWFCRHIAFC